MARSAILLSDDVQAWMSETPIIAITVSEAFIPQLKKMSVYIDLLNDVNIIVYTSPILMNDEVLITRADYMSILATGAELINDPERITILSWLHHALRTIYAYRS